MLCGIFVLLLLFQMSCTDNRPPVKPSGKPSVNPSAVPSIKASNVPSGKPTQATVDKTRPTRRSPPIDHKASITLDELRGLQSQTELVRSLRRGGQIESDKVQKVLSQVDRKNYVHIDPYNPFSKEKDCGYGSIRTPSMCAYILEAFKDNLKPGRRALDIACGSGFLTACFALMIGRLGYVVGVESDPSVIKFATENIRRDKYDLLSEHRVRFAVGELEKGAADKGPYDAIFYGASHEGVPKEYPAMLLSQLNPGGKMIVLAHQSDKDYTNPRLVVYTKNETGDVDAIIEAYQEEKDLINNILYLLEPDCDRETAMNVSYVDE